MTHLCPNCHYLRKPTDVAPEWQCPQCEIAYNKGAGAAVPENYGRYPSAVTTGPAANPGVAKRLVVLTLLALAIWAGKSLWQPLTASTKESAPLAGQPTVLLYATDWCGYCAATRDFFAANGIRYTELDIEKSSTAHQEHQDLGGNGVPLVVVGDKVVHGYNEAELRALLRPWLRKI